MKNGSLLAPPSTLKARWRDELRFTAPLHHRVFGHRRKPMGAVRPHGQVASCHNAENDVIFIDSEQNGLQNRSKTPASSPTLSPIWFFPSAPRREKPYLLRKFNVTEQLKVKCETCDACSVEQQKMKSQTSGFPQQELANPSCPYPLSGI